LVAARRQADEEARNAPQTTAGVLAAETAKAATNSNRRTLQNGGYGMSLYLGDTPISAVYIGDTPVKGIEEAGNVRGWG